MLTRYLVWFGILGAAAGCGGAGVPVESLEPAAQDVQEADLLRGHDRRDGRHLFTRGTFGGNGRACRTCHSEQTGTLTPAEIQALYRHHPNDPLFQHDGSDDFYGHGYSRLLADATILVPIALPTHVRLVDDPTARSVTLRHGIPSTLNTPALDPVLMYDGRAPNLVEQARGAIHGHLQNTVEPTEDELRLIAEFEQSAPFFSSGALRRFAQGGPAPTLPEGHTPAEKRGRRFFLDVPVSLQDGTGFCAVCHSGPMLNQVNDFNPLPIPPFRVEPGTRFQSILSAELLPNGDPLRTYEVTQPDGTVLTVTTSDPGLALQTGDFRTFPFGDLGKFKIPTLWNVKNTAPYFHNNGAKTLEDVMRHYANFFAIAVPNAIPGAPPFILTEQDQADIIAYLKLL
ncbi:MAG TPA: hypothetical protein VH877_06680 [Polyangia bacterium]|nr:hypothetical protein [Polyangia bacterium]